MGFKGAEYEKGVDKKDIKIELLEQDDHVGGRRVSEWITDWWNWTISQRIEGNQDQEPVHFLRINRFITDPGTAFRVEFIDDTFALKNQAILFPVLNTMIDNGTFPSENTTNKRRDTAKNENNASPVKDTLECRIDGHNILGQYQNDKEKLRMCSNEFDLEAFDEPLVKMDFPIPVGVHKAITDGYFVCIKKLPPNDPDDPYIIRIHSEGVSGYYINIIYRLFIADDPGALFDYKLLPTINEKILGNNLSKGDAKKMIPKAFK